MSCRKSQGKWAKSGPNTRNWATRGHVTPPRPHPLPHPEGRFPHPQTHVGEPHLWVRTHQRAYRALEMGGQNGCPAGNLRENGPNTLPWPVSGVSVPNHFLPIYHSKEVLHRPIDQIIGINHIGKVAPPQVPPIYTKMVGSVLNTTICDL